MFMGYKGKYHMNLPCLIAFLTLALLLLLPIVKCKVPAVIVFGDSSVDPGNNNFISTVARSDFLPYGRDLPDGTPTGRFCNGRIPTDFISEKFGLKKMIPPYLDPSYRIADFATGVSFASAGTGYDNATSGVLSVIPLWKEVEYYKEYQSRLRDYLGNDKAQEIIQESLYTISIGTNDFMENYYTLPDRQSQFTINQYEDYLASLAEDFLRKMYDLGARKFSLGGICPMGCLPLERAVNIIQGFACQEQYNVVARDFNVKLQSLADKLNRELPGMRIAFSNSYDLFMDMIQDPDKYGLEVVDRGCCGTGQFEMGYICNEHNPFTCTDADEYMFWDSFHPTQRTNEILADFIVKNPLAQFHQ